MIKNGVFLIMCFFVTFSCGKIIRPLDCKFEIANESDFDIKISLFFKSALKQELKIVKGEKFSKKIENCKDVLNPFNINPDSLIIQFDNKRIIKQYCNGKTLFGFFEECKYEKSLLDRAYYKIINNVFKKTYRMTYDNSDYETAIPL
jgi:hypothetical protein